MIEVKFYSFKNGSFKFTCRGHAGAGEKGNDPICAGASALAYGLLENVYMVRDMLESVDNYKKDGIMRISFKPKPEFFPSLYLLFTAKRNEFRALERGHEKHIKVW